jgi:hypothetical protein
MGQITQDGFTFDSDWIDSNVAKFKDQSDPGAIREEIAMREEDLKSMLSNMPNDFKAHAHLRAYIAALKQLKST